VLNVKAFRFTGLNYLLGKLLLSILLVSISFPVAIFGLNQPAQTVTSTVTTSSVSITILGTFSASISYSGGYLVTAVPKGSSDCGHCEHYVFNASTGPITGTVTSNNTQLNFELARFSDFNTRTPLQPDASRSGKNYEAVTTSYALQTQTSVTNPPTSIPGFPLESIIEGLSLH